MATIPSPEAIAPFAIGLFTLIWLALMIRAMRKGKKKKMAMKALTPEQEALKKSTVTLTPEEQKGMKKTLMILLAVVTIVIGLVTFALAFDYWRFAVRGESVSATVMSVSNHRSSGRRSKTTYTYTLKATVDGKNVTDSYAAGSNGSYKIGSTVDAYATQSDSSTQRVDLAIKDVIDRSPLWEVLALSVLGLISFISFRRWKRIQSGSMKFSELLKQFQNRRLRALESDTATMPSQVSSTTPNGLPVYTIGGGSTQPGEIRDDFPKT